MRKLIQHLNNSNDYKPQEDIIINIILNKLSSGSTSCSTTLAITRKSKEQSRIGRTKRSPVSYKFSKSN